MSPRQARQRVAGQKGGSEDVERCSSEGNRGEEGGQKGRCRESRGKVVKLCGLTDEGDRFGTEDKSDRLTPWDHKGLEQ